MRCVVSEKRVVLCRVVIIVLWGMCCEKWVGRWRTSFHNKCGCFTSCSFTSSSLPCDDTQRAESRPHASVAEENPKKCAQCIRQSAMLHLDTGAYRIWHTGACNLAQLRVRVHLHRASLALPCQNDGGRHLVSEG
jgi:hypothetical protein